MKPFAIVMVVALPATAAAESDADIGASELAAAIRHRDVKAIADKLETPFAVNALWFPDAACRKQFGKASILQTKHRDTFARCLAKLSLQLSTRRSSTPYGAILTAEPGIEIELAFRGTSVSWIGLPGQESPEDGTPMLTAQAFEALRTGGTTMLDPVVHKELYPLIAKSSGPATAWIKTCLSTTGEVTRTTSVQSSVTAAGQVFQRATRDWRFKPFKLRDVASAACSLTLLAYPFEQAPLVEMLPPSSAGVTRIKRYDFEDDLISP